MKLSGQAVGAVRTFAYFLASGTHYMLAGLDARSLWQREPSAIEQAVAIFANVLEWDPESGEVLNGQYAQARAVDYLIRYLVPGYVVDPPYQEWETALDAPPPLDDLASTPQQRAYIERLATQRLGEWAVSSEQRNIHDEQSGQD